MRKGSTLLSALAGCCSLLVAACAVPQGDVASTPQADGGHVAVWTTSADGKRLLAKGENRPLVSNATLFSPSDPVLKVDPEDRKQSMVGFGAAMTDASAILFQKTLTQSARDRLFSELFGRRDGGLGLSFLRVPIGASDFSTKHYSLDDMPKGQRDPELAHFSMAVPDEAQVPALRAALQVNPAITLVASPWSAPGWMKTSDSLITGHMRPDAYAPFADYLSRYVAAMAKRGIPIAMLTLQNEPHFEPDSYPGMWMDPKDRAAVDGQYLGPLLAQRNQHVRLLDWDHNWDHPEEPLGVLSDPQAARYVSGIAWHCYGGDVSAMDKVKAAYPDKDAYITECSGGTWAPEWGSTLGWMTDNLIIAATRYGSRGAILWNLALDEKNGPHLGGCATCRGVVTIDSKTGAVTRNLEYYVLGHVSRFVVPGARRIASTEAGKLVDVAFRNPDGSLVLLVHNQDSAPRTFTVEAGGEAFHAELPAGEIATYVWRGHPSAR